MTFTWLGLPNDTLLAPWADGRAFGIRAGVIDQPGHTLVELYDAFGWRPCLLKKRDQLQLAHGVCGQASILWRYT